MWASRSRESVSNAQTLGIRLKLAYLETDASVDTRRSMVGLDGRLHPAGAGIILRDLRLRPLIHESIALGEVPGPLHAEYLALAFGLERAAERGFGGVWATTDNLPLVQAFNGLSEIRGEGLRVIKDRLDGIRARFGFVTLRWSRGSHRKRKFDGPSADALARAAIGLGGRK